MSKLGLPAAVSSGVFSLGAEDFAEDFGALDEIGDGIDELLAPAEVDMEGNGVGVFLGHLRWCCLAGVHSADRVGVHFGKKFFVLGKLGDHFSSGCRRAL